MVLRINIGMFLRHRHCRQSRNMANQGLLEEKKAPDVASAMAQIISHNLRSGICQRASRPLTAAEMATTTAKAHFAKLSGSVGRRSRGRLVVSDIRPKGGAPEGVVEARVRKPGRNSRSHNNQSPGRDRGPSLQIR
jgi:hypothetical protein